MGGEGEDLFKRDVPVEAAVVTKDELVEVRRDVLAAQPVIGPQSPTLHQREGAMRPWQNDVRRHLADDARIMPIVVA